MIRRTCLPFAITLLALLASSALAQSAVGGATKPINHVGGATTHPNPVVPPAKGVTANAASSNPTSTKNLSNATLAKNPPSPTSTSTKKK